MDERSRVQPDQATIFVQFEFAIPVTVPIDGQTPSPTKQTAQPRQPGDAIGSSNPPPAIFTISPPPANTTQSTSASSETCCEMSAGNRVLFLWVAGGLALEVYMIATGDAHCVLLIALGLTWLFTLIVASFYGATYRKKDPVYQRIRFLFLALIVATALLSIVGFADQPGCDHNAFLASMILSVPCVIVEMMCACYRGYRICSAYLEALDEAAQEELQKENHE